MHRAISCFLFLTALLFCAPQISAAVVVHYTFQNNLLDQSGNGNHATLVGGPTYVPGEGGGNAIYFNNPLGAAEGTDYILLPNSASIAALDGNSSTMAVRFKTLDSSTNNGRLMGDNVGGKGFNLNYNSSLTGEAHGAIFGTSSNVFYGNYATVNPAGIVTDGNWHWAVVTHDAVAKEVKFYIDGQLIDTDSYTNLGQMSYNGMAIGRYNGAGATNYAARLTTVQEFQLHDVALSAAQVAAIPEPGTLGLACLAIVGVWLYKRRT